MSRKKRSEDFAPLQENSQQGRGGLLTFGSTSISGNAHAVLGNVVHNHTHYHASEASNLAGTNRGYEGAESRQLSRHKSLVTPNAISEYKSKYEHWLRQQQRLEGTCTWLFDTSEYQNWLATDSDWPVLICTGSVGSGKSILASAVVDNLAHQQEDNPPLIVSFYVDAFRDRSVTTIELLRALIKQLLQHYKGISKEVPQAVQHFLREAFPDGSAFLATPQAIKCIQAFIHEMRTCFFVFDGVDAMAEKEILTLLQFVRLTFCGTEFVPSPRLIIFCRDTLGRGIRLEQLAAAKLFQIDITHLRSDIHRYVDHQVDQRQSERAISADASLIEEVKTVLRNNSSKMFLWVRLQLVSLWDPGLITCDRDIKQQLTSLPEGLDETYVHCLRRIEATNDKRTRQIAPKAFKWVASAKVALTQAEIQEAVSIDPEDLPLQSSMVLSSPVQDYCANLLVLDVSTGTVTFPHPSVKTFLRDADRLPLELKRHQLSATEDDLWCGALCLAYISFLQKQKQVVPFQSQKVATDVVSPILNTISAGWLSRLLPTSRKIVPSQLRLPLNPRRSTSVKTDFCLHGYICRYWLLHNLRITEDRVEYPPFERACLSNDTQTQPWIDDTTTGNYSYLKMVEYAVMTDHAPLLRVAVRHIRSRKALFNKVFNSPCPGTQSTWLHVCSALGHEAAIGELTGFCDPLIANEGGQSAAAVTAENGHTTIFKRLMDVDSKSWISRHLHTFSSGPQSTVENLLRVCASCGNTQALGLVLLHVEDRAPSLLYCDQQRSDALFHAAYYGRESTASMLVDQGARLDRFMLPSESETYFRQKFGIDSGWSVLETALNTKNPRLLDTLMSVSTYWSLMGTSTFSDRDWDMADVIDWFEDEKNNFHVVEPFLAVLTKHQRLLNHSRAKSGDNCFNRILGSSRTHIIVDGRYRNKCLQFILSLLFILLDVNNLTTKGNNFRICTAPRLSLMRQNYLSDSSFTTSHGVEVYNAADLNSLNEQKRASRIFKFAEELSTPFVPSKDWTANVCDKLFIHMLHSGWIDSRELLRPPNWNRILNRHSPRALQTLLSYLHYDEVLKHQSSLPEDQIMFMFNYLSYHACSSPECESTIEQAIAKHREDLLVTRKTHTIFDSELLLEGYSRHLEESHDHFMSKHLFYTAVKNATLEPVQEPILQVLVCYFPDFRRIRSEHRESDVSNTISELHDALSISPCPAVDVASNIAWLSCYRLQQVREPLEEPRSRAAFAFSRSQQLLNVGSDADHSLNFPFGYRSISHERDSFAIDKRIIASLYGWAYRINRKNSRAWSEADKWYLGWKFEQALKYRRLQRDDNPVHAFYKTNKFERLNRRGKLY